MFKFSSRVVFEGKLNKLVGSVHESENNNFDTNKEYARLDIACRRIQLG